MSGSRKYPYSPSGGRGLKGLDFKRKGEAKLEFSEG